MHLRPTRTHPPTPRRAGQWSWRLTARSLAGSSARDRGTILLMVVGVLALLAIIGVVYATIGRSDRVTSATKQRSQRANDQVDDVAVYLAGVIGDATFAQYPELTFGQPVLRSRGYTYPNTDKYFQSVQPGGTLPTGLTYPGTGPERARYTKFQPTGSCNLPWPTLNIQSDRSYGDPYLAALEPEYLLKPDGVTPYTAVIGGNAKSYANRHDLRTISNFGPSGNRVNLANLRTSRAGFAAEPGFGATAAGKPRMSFGVTLFDATTGRPQPVGTPTAPIQVKRWDGANANPLVPSDWCTNLLWAFRPNIPDLATTPASTTINPASYEYLPNFMADADGDGFVDSGWYELVDVSNAYANVPQIVSKIPTRGRTRIFVAARCIDSSAMVQVNTASDQSFAPLSGNPLDSGLWRDNAAVPGATPGDIDLLRLMGMSDIVQDQTLAGVAAADRGLAGGPKPAPGSSESAVGDYANGANPYDGTPNGAARIGRYTYGALQDGLSRGTTRGATNLTTLNQYAISALSRSGNYALFNSGGHTGSLEAPTSLSRYTGNPYDLSDELELRAFFGVNDSDSLSRLEATVAGRTSGAAQLQSYSPFRDNRSRALEMKWRDEREPDRLFANYVGDMHNREAILSVFSDVRHLVTTVNGGRSMKGSAVAPDMELSLYDPPYNTKDYDDSGATTDITAALQAIINYGSYERAPLANDPARYGVNATGQITLNTTFDKPAKDDYVAYTKGVELIFRLYLNALAPYTDEDYDSPDGNRHPGHFPNMWRDYRLNTDLLKSQGLVYGGNPELAIRMAAHMTANFIDAFDRERKLDPTTGRPYVDPTTHAENLGINRNEPTSLTIDLARTSNLTTTLTGITGPSYREPGRQSGRGRRFGNAYQGLQVFGDAQGATYPTSVNRRLCPNVRDLSSAGPYTGSSPTFTGRMNIFGIEPQPFLTEIGSFFIYAANPGSGPGGGSGGGSGGPGGSSGGGGSGLMQGPTNNRINFSLEVKPLLESNTSFIGEFIAFQLNNPFDQDVVLYDPNFGPMEPGGAIGAPAGVTGTGRPDRFHFYLEYAGRYYAFAPASKTTVNVATDTSANRDPVILHAGETRTFYTCSPGSLSEMAERARAVIGSPVTNDEIENWIAGHWSGTAPSGSGQLFSKTDYNPYTTPQTNQSDALLGNPQRPQQLVQVYPTTFQLVKDTEVAPGHGNKFMDIWGEYDVNGSTPNERLYASNDVARRVAHLWRTIRSHSSLNTNSTGIQGDLVDGTIGANTDINLNDVTNDLLADRLRDPVTTNPTLMKGRSRAIPISFDFEPPSSGPVTETFAAVIWGAVRRPTDTSYNIDGTATPTNSGTLIDVNGVKRPARGVLPPWCLEVKSDDDYASLWTWKSPSTGTPRTPTDFSMNQADISSPSAAEDYHNYLDGTSQEFPSLRALLNSTKQANKQIGRPCSKKNGNDIKILPPLGGVGGADRHYSDVAVEFYDVGEDRLGGLGNTDPRAGPVDTTDTILKDSASGTASATLRRSRNPALFTRAGDFLLPLAIGPWFDPSRDSTPVQSQIPWTANDPYISDREVQWMTLSESLALASGYYGPKATTDPALADFARLNPATRHLPMTDRGHLALDRFVPYIKATDTVLQPLGSGVPFALSIIDQFRAAGGISSTPRSTTAVGDASNTLILSDNSLLARGTAPEAQQFPTAYGTLSGPALLPAAATVKLTATSLTLDTPQVLSQLALVPGKLNLNTAPWSTLCTLPLLRPSTDAPWALVAGTVAANQPGASFNGSKYFSTDTQPLAVPPNLAGAAQPIGSWELVQPILDYRNAMMDYSNRTLTHNPLWNPCLPSVGGNAFLPVRREGGIASLGELAYINTYQLTGVNAGAVEPKNSMFHFAAPEANLKGPDPAMPTQTMFGGRAEFHPEIASAGGYDRRADGRLDAGTTITPFAPGNPSAAARMHYDGNDMKYPVQRTGTSQLLNTGVSSNYQDKLAIINALTNTASIRSDIFTVYFLIHAYTPEDVDIPDDQPMVPSVAKRYVMVVDRSNVGAPGIKPRILMLKEVPMP